MNKDKNNIIKNDPEALAVSITDIDQNPEIPERTHESQNEILNTNISHISKNELSQIDDNKLMFSSQLSLNEDLKAMSFPTGRSELKDPQRFSHEPHEQDFENKGNQNIMAYKIKPEKSLDELPIKKDMKSGAFVKITDPSDRQATNIDSKHKVAKSQPISNIEQVMVMEQVEKSKTNADKKSEMTNKEKDMDNHDLSDNEVNEPLILKTVEKSQKFEKDKNVDNNVAKPVIPKSENSLKKISKSKKAKNPHGLDSSSKNDFREEMPKSKTEENYLMALATLDKDNRIINRTGQNKGRMAKNNSINNRKYNIITFFPMIVFNQFKFFFNFYFLLMA